MTGVRGRSQQEIDRTDASFQGQTLLGPDRVAFGLQSRGTPLDGRTYHGVRKRGGFRQNAARVFEKLGSAGELVILRNGRPIGLRAQPRHSTEYEEVLHRRELSLPLDDIEAILAYLRLPGEHVVHIDPTDVEQVCADPDDDVFLAAAVEGGALFVVTGNTGHFPRSPWRGIRIHRTTRVHRVDRVSRGRVRDAAD